MHEIILADIARGFDKNNMSISSEKNSAHNKSDAYNDEV